MKPFPGESIPSSDDLVQVMHGESRPEVAIKWAQTHTLRIAMGMLRAGILSRRAIVQRGDLTREEIDRLASEIQRRADRMDLVAEELRRRGEEVDWTP